jgi:hypothetical protein
MHRSLKSRGPGSAVGIATGYVLDDQGVGVRVLVGKEFSLLRVIQTSSEAHPASYPMGTGGSSLGGVKRLERKADHSPPTSASSRKRGSMHPLPHMS